MNYADFEEQFRGPSEQIRTTQKDYVALLRAGQPGDDALIVDIGCGRGEMLDPARAASGTGPGASSSTPTWWR